MITILDSIIDIIGVRGGAYMSTQWARESSFWQQIKKKKLSSKIYEESDYGPYLDLLTISY